MAQIPQPTLQNSFIGGLKTEFTGLNFPENACTSADNVIFSLIGDVTRREGLNVETNWGLTGIVNASVAQSSYRWLNAGGDGSSQILVVQEGSNIVFYLSSSATTASPLSTTRLTTIISLNSFLVSGSSADPSQSECQYATGNGYLFVFHPNCDPFYCTYAASTITANLITVQIRDTIGIPETGVADNFRPTTLTTEHHYNLFNQGWFGGFGWSATSTTTAQINTVTDTFTVASGLSITNGDFVTATAIVNGNINTLTGTVTSYSGTSLVISFSTASGPNVGFISSNWTFVHTSDVYVSAWFSSIANYPSNSDVWWYYKNTTGNFAPVLGNSGASTVGTNSITQSGRAPRGSMILNAFLQQRSVASGLTGITSTTTLKRPKTGCWYAGRVWYTGVDDTFPASGDAPFYTWSENIYYSQISQDSTTFGLCYETNDPTSETLFDALPTDGGIVVIPGTGSIYKLFPLKFGLLVFAANGIWYIAGSSGLGFSSTDYTVTKISSIRCTNGTSFIDVQGFPMFWNEEGIYYVAPSQQGGSAHSPDIALDVQNLCIGTILSFYADIPSISKKYARGDYHELDYIVQWCFRDSTESGISNRYQFNRILCFNIVNKAFYTYTAGQGTSAGFPFYISDVKYIQSPGGSGAPLPVFKYLLTSPHNQWITFGEENDNINWKDWCDPTFSDTKIDYTSFFISGYNLKGKAVTKFQVPYTYMFSRNPAENKYSISSIWDYAGTGNSGRWSVRQLIDNNNSNFNMLYRKHRLRGRGLAVQIQVTSVSGFPFDLMGWSMMNEVNQGI